MRRQFTSIMDAELIGVLNRSWKYERPLVFSHVILTNTLVISRARYIWSRISRRLELWDRGLYAGLVGDTDVEVDDREVRAARVVEEEDGALDNKFHRMVLSGKL